MIYLWGTGGYSSLFLTPQEKKQQAQPSSPPHKTSALRLDAIFYRPDLRHWIVWINGKRIDSRSPRSIDGWRVVHVTPESVTLRSTQGQEQILYLDRL